MTKNTLKRIMLGLVLIDHETGAVFDRGIYGKEWKLVSPKRAKLLREWKAGETIGHNVVFKG